MAATLNLTLLLLTSSVVSQSPACPYVPAERQLVAASVSWDDVSGDIFRLLKQRRLERQLESQGPAVAERVERREEVKVMPPAVAERSPVVDETPVAFTGAAVAERPARAKFRPDVAVVTTAWPNLSDDVKAQILALVQQGELR